LWTIPKKVSPSGSRSPSHEVGPVGAGYSAVASETFTAAILGYGSGAQRGWENAFAGTYSKGTGETLC